jgi:very-short-patch-repair endonuclease
VAGSATSRRTERVLAAALRRHAGLAETLALLLARYQFHPAQPVLRWYLRELEAGRDPAFLRSEAEEAFLRLVRRAKLPRPEANSRILGVEVDFLWPSHRFIAEIDGRAFHSAESAFSRDRDRDRALAAAGYQVLRFTWHQVKHEGEAVIASVAATLADRRSLTRSTGSGDGAGPGWPSGARWFD